MRLGRLRSSLRSVGANGDIAFAIAVATIIALMLVPVAPPIMDVLLTANLALAVLTLMIVLYTPDVSRLATFPTVLLLATLFRLALNVNSTRLILSPTGDGDDAGGKAGQVIEAFGKLVAGNEALVGAVVFIVLTIVQFLVIAKGAERGSEVQARFTLDQVAGRQMAIDADLRAGIINATGAQRQRSHLLLESRLAGAMESALKFVKGDTIAGILICVINVVGGFLMAWQQTPAGTAFDWRAAMATYTLLTIGDGLVAAIPSLLLSISAALVVTRVADTDDQARGKLARDLGRDVAGQPRGLAITAGLLLSIAASSPVTGFPWPPFLALGCILGALACRKPRPAPAAGADTTGSSEARPKAVRREPPADARPWQIPVRLVLGKALAEQGLTDEAGSPPVIRLTRDVLELCERHGVRRHQIRVQVDPAGGTTCRLELRNTPIATIDLAADYLFFPRALLPVARLAELGAVPLDPRGWLASIVRVGKDQAPALQAAGVETIPAADLVAMTVRQQLRVHLDDLMSVEDVDDLIKALRARRPELVETMIPRQFGIPQLHDVLQALLREQVPIRDLPTILAAMATYEPGQVVGNWQRSRLDAVRAAVLKTLIAELAHDGVVQLQAVDPQLEDVVRLASEDLQGGDDVRQAVGAALAARPMVRPVLLAKDDVRLPLVQMLAPVFPDLTVLSLTEYTSALGYARFQAVGKVRLLRAPAGQVQPASLATASSP
ncbi:MAG: FHIPEP family type III secretion protein [Planctomycetes bacterium]|nr:FHIPEP family type III secretion protein [Planctomycetota bacterium]